MTGDPPAGPAALVIALNGHLPYVRDTGDGDSKLERRLYEAIAECYLPLLDVFEGLAKDGVPFRITVSLSPTLIAMLDDPLLQQRTLGHLQRTSALALRETERFVDEPGSPWAPAAAWYRAHFERMLSRYTEGHGPDIFGAFRALSDSGHVELMTSGATHGYLPLMAGPGDDDGAAASNAQIQVATESFERRFGKATAGFWLPECGYMPGVDRLLAAHGIRYAFLAAHGLVGATPSPIAGVALPIVSPAGPAFFGRDEQATALVDGEETGFFRHAAYRSASRDVGFDRELDYVRPFLLSQGGRVATGLKYHRITGDEIDPADLAAWDPESATRQAAEHAREFVTDCRQRAGPLGREMGRAPVFALSFDAAFFGRRWYEGPQFLDALFRELAHDPDTLVARTPSEVLNQTGQLQQCVPAASSWGRGGHCAAWLDDANAWMQRHLAEIRCRTRAVVVSAARGRSSGPARRAAQQAGREALLAHDSEWPILVKNAETGADAIQRFETHVRRFLTLTDMLNAGEVDTDYVSKIEETTPLFSDLDVACTFVPAPAQEHDSSGVEPA